MIDRIATELPLKAVEAVEAGVRMVWSDGRKSFFHSIWLRDNCYCSQCGDATIGRRTTRLSVRALYSNVLDDDGAFLEMLHNVRDHGICFLDNVPQNPDALEQFARRIGPPQESNFGRIQDLIVDRSKRSIANDVAALKPHTDEPYRASPPGLLMFHCLETDITGGGGSIFLDGFEIAETLRSEDPEAFDSLARNRQVFRRHFTGDVDLIADFPVISLDEFGHVNGVRINDRVGAPLSIPSHEVPQYYRGMHRLLSLSEDPARCIV